MRESTILSQPATLAGRVSAAPARATSARNAAGATGLWTVLSQLLWYGRPCEVLSDHLLSDIGVSRFDLETSQP